jgi:DNA invertase Pin-like site-specific DNA recombinase
MSKVPYSGQTWALYHRVSNSSNRDTSSESYITEDVAFGKLDAWATMHGHRGKHYLDRDVSGSKMSRPQFDRMLADLESGAINGIAVAQVDRLSRADVGDAMRVIREILDIAPKGLALLDLGVDPTTEMGEFCLTVLLGISHMQWRRYRRQYREAQSRAITRRGVFIGRAPFGYVAPVVGQHPNGRPIYGPLEPHPTEGPIVTAMFRLAASDGLHAAVAHLERELPDRTWPTYNVRRILKQRVYLGEVRRGDLVNLDAHPPLIDPVTFAAAESKPRTRRDQIDYPLSKIAVCGKCGEGLTGSAHRRGEHTYRNMACGNRACTGGATISATNLERWVDQMLRTMLAQKAFRDRFAPAGLDDAREALDAAKRERTRYLADTTLREIVGEEDYHEGARARTRAVNDARDRFELLASTSARADALPAPDELSDPAQLARALALVDRIVIRPGRGPIDERVLDVAYLDHVDDVTGAELAA